MIERQPKGILSSNGCLNTKYKQDTLMSNISVIEIDNKLVVDSRLIAKDLGVDHGNWIRNVVKKYKTHTEKAFGILRFENGEIIGRGQPEKFVYLTENQATFLMTISRNTPEVIRCKINLVKQFSEAKKLLTQKKGNLALPKDYISALEALVKSEKQKVLLQQEKELLEQEKQLLEEDNQRQAEAIDELFDYSSIIRVAKYNKASEKLFNWRLLKAASIKLTVEIKKIPCPRYGEKNIYSHNAWRLAYPGVPLPETTTLVIQNN